MATEIYCPKCEWEPRASDRWWCSPGCHTAWNTFETRALCPGCHKQWHVTQCLSCRVLSPHEDWYHEVQPQEEAIAAMLGQPAQQPQPAAQPEHQPDHQSEPARRSDRSSDRRSDRRSDRHGDRSSQNRPPPSA